VGEPRQNIIGERVKQARLAYKPPLTQQNLSNKLIKLGVSLDRAGVAKIENGMRGALDFEVVALAKALGCKASWLLGLKE